VSEVRIPRAGDPFTSAPTEEQDRPHACYEGSVYLGRITLDEGGEEVEVTEVVPCRRCEGAKDALRGAS
jgi:hypothetical protein